MYLYPRPPHTLSTNSRLRVCLYFGTFAPIHIGHTNLASYALKRMDIDQLWFIPSPLSPHKSAQSQWSMELRLNLLSSVIRHHTAMYLCPIELWLPLPHYSIRTMRSLSALYPEVEFHILMGADNIMHIHNWHKADRLLQTYPIHIYPRPGYNPEVCLQSLKQSAKCTFYPDAPQTDISSTQIRQLIASNQDYSPLLPTDSCTEILRNHFMQGDNLSYSCQSLLLD